MDIREAIIYKNVFGGGSGSTEVNQLKTDLTEKSTSLVDLLETVLFSDENIADKWKEFKSAWKTQDEPAGDVIITFSGDTLALSGFASTPTITIR